VHTNTFALETKLAFKSMLYVMFVGLILNIVDKLIHVIFQCLN
jgi:hypothetical protein